MTLPHTNDDRQYKLIDFVNDPETIRKAVEGSMDKRRAVLHPTGDGIRPTLSIDPSALGFYFEAMLPEIPKSTRLGMVQAITRGITQSQSELLDEAIRLLPEKRDMKVGGYYHFNQALREVTATLLTLKERIMK